MRTHGRVLAELHKLSLPRAGGNRLLRRLVENESVLNEVRIQLTDDASTSRRVVPAADWLLDNFYLIEEQIRASKRDLPKGYSRGLPHLEGGQSSGLPRVYDIALERVSHGDGLVDPETLVGFLEAYQSVSTLTLGELWAIPIMLRLSLIENLRRVATRISAGMAAQVQAASWADRMTRVAESDPKSLILLVADMARSDPRLDGSFVAELARKLQGKGSSLALPLTWIEQRLSETGTTIERLVQSAMQQQAADQVSISNSIRSLRSLGATDWRRFVEGISLVEKTLREDPANCYERMDFSTRDRYRHVVEETARKSRRAENDVARSAIKLASECGRDADIGDRRVHVGYYLIDRGIAQLHRSVHVHSSFAESISSIGSRFVLGIYAISILVLSGVIATAFVAEARSGGAQSWQLWLIAALALLCSSELSTALVNWVVTVGTQPRVLPRMDYTEGIPPESRTLVVVPAMLSSVEHIERLIEALEVRFLANRDENLFFGLLTDFPDADEKTLPTDGELVRCAGRKIEELNELYRNARGDSFYLFHRGRRWNSHENKWMGHERKRGKLADLNALLREAATDRFDLLIGRLELLPPVKYVITLDTDTQLPRDSARRLAGAMAHPLNLPRFDERRGRIVEGYGILQPRVASSLTGAHRSLYARLGGGEPGMDPYTRAVSDVYQDLFGEGSFIGKGIYDVDAFEQVLKGRFPENRILSHDLLEGCFARSGLLSDVQFFEASPSTYRADVARRRRWIRGDWQLFRWVLPLVPGSDARSRRNPLSALSKWKLLDNLRRSLISAALTLFLILGWAILSDPLLWTLSVAGIFFLPSLIVSLHGLLRKPEDMLLGSHLSAAFRAPFMRLAQSLFALACLPYEAYFSLGAIARTAWRMLVSHKHLLEWAPSDDQDRKAHAGLVASFLSMWISAFLAVSTAVYLSLSLPATFRTALPILLVWLASPAIAWWVGRPMIQREARLKPEQLGLLRRLSRKTWAFFETFVTAQEHWLPPDNYQELPVPKIAHRSSPTNMGLALLANLAARDFGYIPVGRLLERSSLALRSMESLERHRNHFYNWYDTRTLQPLAPRYVSTVDSGNLAAHLLTLRQGLIAIPDEGILGARIWEGMLDTQNILAGLLMGAPPAALARFQNELKSASSLNPTELHAARELLVRLAAASGEVTESLADRDGKELKWWAEALESQCRDALYDLDYLAPWLSQHSPLAERDEILAPTGSTSLRDVLAFETDLLKALEPNMGELGRLVAEGLSHARARLDMIEALALQTEELSNMDFEFLYDKRRHLLSIGYMVDGHRQDPGFYDLLASEARIASFVAIAQAQIPQENWFALGRLLADVGGKSVLFSWSGSMFEYLMPLLVMPTYANTLLDQTCKAAIVRQIEYGRQRAVPWGISESGYNSFDVGLNYQYRAFGVPGLGLKRGLVDDLVVAPYASALSLLLMPEKACLNLQRMSAQGIEGDYGLYEAIDYTPSRVPSGQNCAVIRSFMAHHQGMSLLSYASRILDQPMQKRFESIPMVRATTLLLEEKIPRATVFHSRSTDLPELLAGAEALRPPARTFSSPDTPLPEVHLLSNGKYHVMVTNAGGGYSRWKELAVTRWVEDATRDNWGTFLYIRDMESGEVWSSAFQPTLKRPDHYEAIFSAGRAEFRRRDHEIDTYTEIAVSPEDDIELRRFRIANRSRFQRTIEVTSYAEVALATPAADAAHPAFSKLFVQTEIIAEKRAILCTRRPRSSGERNPWMLHLMTVRDAQIVEVSQETDRMRFLGRGNSAAAPRAGNESGPLSGSQGSVLDPIVAIRYRLVLEPDFSATIDMVTGIAEDRDAAMHIVEKYQDKRFVNRAFELAQTHSQMILQQINGNEFDAQLFGRLAGSVLYANSGLRAESNILAANRRGQSGLWGYSISGDLPILLLLIKNPANLAIVRQLVQAHAYWRLKGLAVDLVIWNEEHGGYRQLLQDQILGLVTAGVEANVVDRPGGIFIRSADQISGEDRILIQSAARVVISDALGTLEDQIGGRSIQKIPVPRLIPSRVAKSRSPADMTPRSNLLFFNGLGGFSPDGDEYVIATAGGQTTPAPWVNVIANPRFGTVVSETGMAYTWSENAHEFRLSPWLDDPVSDASGEAFYIRDEESGQFWSPSPLPRGGDGPYLARHGFGYSVFEHSEWGIVSELWVYVEMDAPVKFSVLKIRNESGRSRRLSATSYVELVLGDLRSKTAMHVVTEADAETGAVLSRNWYSAEFAGRVVFLDVLGEARSFTCDRSEFIGRNGSLQNPAAMKRTHLSGKAGAALDPCAALQLPFELLDGQECEIVFRFGSGHDIEEANSLIRRFRSPGAAQKALEGVRRFWHATLSAVQVETPDKSLDVMANGWLMYEVLSCRLWGRSGYYQSGGAFGFRDQLQDVMALIHAQPSLVREQLLLCAGRQFPEGDVQHWWHPPLGRGSRTRCSDDYLWLPLAAWRYVSNTGDIGVLDEAIHFIEGRPIKAPEDSYYDLPTRSEQSASLYEHCRQAILKSMGRGAHGLPLMGSGDWNDGMNLVGVEGRGESVWLAFFLHEVLTKFSEIAVLRHDQAFADQCRQEAEELRGKIEEHGWDGAWYRRAFFDDGTPLGSADNPECQIDSIAQSWSVLSGAGDRQRSLRAMDSLDERLVSREHALVQLLDPPFDSSPMEPGYIKGYVPGVRENGGQYTHAAIWAAMAFARLGDAQRAWELFTMINPVNHANSEAKVETYKVEPYVMAADVYSLPPHTGRGGWTWYSGSAGWMYRLITESLLGLALEGDRLSIHACLPPDWPGFTMRYRYRETLYRIAVLQLSAGNTGTRVILDGVEQNDETIPLVDDGKEHAVEVSVSATISSAPAPQALP
jgi:cellobiose phosphorylase